MVGSYVQVVLANLLQGEREGAASLFLEDWNTMISLFLRVGSVFKEGKMENPTSSADPATEE